MKKVFILLLAVMILVSSVSFAEDLSALSDDELTELYMRVTEEMAGRKTAAGETAGEGFSPEQAAEPAETPEVSADTVLYYHPEGGQYYHADQNCLTIKQENLPLKGSFTYAELEDEAYKDLLPCEVCEAPARQEAHSLPVSFRDAADAAGEYAAVGGDIDYLAVAEKKDGRYFRTVTLLDDRAKELYMAVMAADDAGAAFEAFDAYAWSLPVCYTEEITAKPKDQAELDALAGKTVGELMAEGYAFYGVGGGENLPTVVDLSYGMFIYEFEVDASFEEYLENGDWGNPEDLTVKGGALSASLSLAVNLDYLADGTCQPQVVPNYTAEEAAAADAIPPLEEYSVKAWPFTAESYSGLLEDIDAGYGRVYLIKGVVRQVLSQDPFTAVINTGEDGESQPVVVRFPAQLGISLEAGSSCRIYADVSSALFILPVLTARYIFFTDAADEAPAAAGE